MKTFVAFLAAALLCAGGAYADCAGITSIERSSETIGPEAQVRTLNVVAPDGCVWDAVPSERFVTIVSKPASGSGVLTYRVAANPFTTQRGAQIAVSQFPLSITQNAAVTPLPFRGDINGDGLADSFYDPNNYRIWWGSPTQGPWNLKLTDQAGAGMVVAMGSFSGDGHAGYALYDPATLQVNIAFVSEGGNLTIAPVRKIVNTNWEIAGAGDFDGDLKSDLLLRNVEQGLLSIWFMDGATLREAPGVNTRVVSPSWQIAGIADFDHDGKYDILFRNGLTGGLSIWKMNGASVTSFTDLPSKALPWRVVDVGDFNGDGNFDLLYRHGVTGAIEYHLMQNMAVTSVVPHPATVLPYNRIVAVADVNGDGSDDVVTQVNDGTNITQARRTMSTAAVTDISAGPWGLFKPRYRREAAVSDFNGDGRSDILLRHATWNDVASWEMNGTTILRDTAFARASSSDWHFQQIAPFSGDLMSDVQLSNSGYLAMWELAGQSVLNSDEVGFAAGREVRGSGDFDGDGNADLLLQYTTTREIEVWLMAGHAVRSRTIIGTPESDETFDCVGDFDADGMADVVFRNPSGAYIAWFMAGNARRQRAVMGTLSPNWKTLGTLDFFGDGRASILQRSPNTDEVAAATYSSVSGMYGYIIGGAGVNGKYQAAGDYNGDGRPEILIRNASNGTVTMWFISGVYVYSRQTFAYVSSPLWEFVGAFEPTPTNAPYAAPATEFATGYAGPSLAPLEVETRTSEPVIP